VGGVFTWRAIPMRVLHLVKTTDGAAWAAQQAAVLVREGVEVHVALPALSGRTMPEWVAGGAQVHRAAIDFPAAAPWRLPGTFARLRRLVAEIQPDLIHSHFVGTTQVMRYALGPAHPVPRVFQVPGPLHLEHAWPRRWEMTTAGPRDFWIASSLYTHGCYMRAGVDPGRVFTSYYGTRVADYESSRRPGTRARFGVEEGAILVGNVSYMYAPKWYLGQRRGLKGHEDVIDAVALAAPREPRLQGLLAGGAWGKGRRYERSLRRRAERRAPGRIVMPGAVSGEDAARLWPEFDLVVHAPRSENCGGVHEAMIAGTPVLVAPVGGLPELVIDGVTGRCVAEPTPRALADGILAAIRDPERTRLMARAGRERVRRLFDVERTAREVLEIYHCVLRGRSPQDLERHGDGAEAWS
jgi:glycosyltransferase involved in cell wall biosynthesis